MSSNGSRLREFVRTLNEASLESVGGAPDCLEAALSNLVATDDWLPDAFAVPGEDSYRQYLLYCDPFERFSVVSFVWAAGQETPIHDHINR